MSAQRLFASFSYSRVWRGVPVTGRVFCSRADTTMMKAVGLKSYGDISVIEDLRVPKPVLDEKSSKSLLVRLYGSDMNSLDLKMREGKISKDLSSDGHRVMGYSSAGVVEAMGEESMANSTFKVGDAVWFANDWGVTNGSNQEYVLIDHRVVALKPQSLTSFAEAAAIPLVALTAWGALIEHMHMDVDLFPTGEDFGGRQRRFTSKNKGVLLVLPGGGATGSFALQLAAKYLNRNQNLTVIATASRPESVEWCKKMGADHVIDHKAESFRAELVKIGVQGGLDYVFYGTPPEQHEDKLYAVMNPMGQIASYHEGPFEKTEQAFAKRISIHRMFMETRFMFNYFPEVDGQILAKVAEIHDDPSLGFVTVVTKKFDGLTAKAVREAHKWQSGWNATGKAVFEIQ